MKRTLLITIGLLVTLLLAARNVTPEQAEQTARQFLAQRHPAAKSARMKMAARHAIPVTQASDASAYYVFNVGEDKGYVMVSGSDLTPEVLAYATSGSFDQEQIPDNMRTWLQGYADQIAYIEQTEGRYQAPRKVTEHAAISPLIASKWNQGAPYYNLCPQNASGVQTVTGCVATALAQVINYYRYPAQTTQPIPSYTTRTLGLNIDETPVTAIDWDNMLDSYTGSETEAQNQAVATLMMLCGRAVKMDYDISANGGSAAFTPEDVNALRNYFGYDPSARCVQRKAYGTDAWEELVYTELASQRPVIYAGSSTTGGHSFVVDGYSSDGLFHINWGWGGSSDEYFLLSVLNPYNNAAIGSNSSDDGFSYDQEAIIGIQCDGTGQPVADNLYVENMYMNGSTTFTRSSSSDNFGSFRVYMNVWNFSGVTHTFDFAASIQTQDGSWAVPDAIDSYSFSLNNTNGLTGMWYTVSFGAGLPDGEYRIVPVCKVSGQSQWINCVASETQCVRAVINGNTLTLTPPTIALVPDFSSVSSAKLAETTTLRIPITNNGTYFNNELFLVVDDCPVIARILEVGAGESAVWEVDFMPTSLGTHTLQLAYKTSLSSNSELTSIAGTQFNVTADIISVTEALDIITPLASGEQTTGQYVVEGIVSGAVSYNADNRNFEFDIMDVNAPTKKLHIYRADKYNGSEITDGSILQTGYRIIIMGCLKKYGSTLEQVYGNIVSITPGEAPGPEEGAISVAEARNIALVLNNKATTTDTYRIVGYVTDNPDIQKRNDGTFYGNANFHMADQADGTTTIYGYRVKGLDNESINSSDYLQKGDRIVVEGKLQNYNSTPEIVNGYLVYLERPTAVVSITADSPQDSISYNLAGQKVTGQYRGLVVTGDRKILRK